MSCSGTVYTLLGTLKNNNDDQILLLQKPFCCYKPTLVNRYWCVVVKKRLHTLVEKFVFGEPWERPSSWCYHYVYTVCFCLIRARWHYARYPSFLFQIPNSISHISVVTWLETMPEWRMAYLWILMEIYKHHCGARHFWNPPQPVHKGIHVSLILKET